MHRSHTSSFGLRRSLIECAGWQNYRTHTLDTVAIIMGDVNY